MTWPARLLLAFLAALLLSDPTARAADAVSHPPYPEIWGRELPGLARFVAPLDGDLAVALTITPPGKRYEDGAFALLGFFKGDRRAVTKPEFDAVYDRLAKSPDSLGTFSRTQRIGFADGSVLATEEMARQRDDQWTCDVGAPVIVKKDARGKVVWRRIMVRLLEHPIQSKADQNCKDGGKPFTVRTEFWRLTYEDVYGLADGTFLTYFNGVGDGDENLAGAEGMSADRRYAVRFDSELRSPFLAGIKDLVVADAAVLEPILAELARHPPHPATAARTAFHERVYAALKKLKPDAAP